MRATRMSMQKARERAARFARLSWGALAYLLFIFLFWALTGANGGGAGYLPIASTIQWLIAGVAVVLPIILVVLAWRVFGKGHPVRWSAGLGLWFTLVEAMIGVGWATAGLSTGWVIFLQVVGSINRLFWLASLALMAWWSSGGAPIRLSRQGKKPGMALAALAGMLLLEVTGVMVAPGNGLPALETRAVAGYFTHFRVYYLALAVLVTLYVTGLAWWIRAGQSGPSQRRWLAAGIALFGVQLVLGGIGLLPGAPVWVQWAHRLAADLSWLVVVLSVALLLGDAEKTPALRLVHDLV